MFKLSIFLLLLPFFSFAQFMHHEMNASPAKDVFLNMMDKMMMKMDDIPATKSADRDFLQMMIPHHEGAINMADYEIRNGRNREMIQLAKSIKAEQQVQIRQMQLSLGNRESFVVTGTRHIEPNKQMMVAMMDKMPSDKIPVNIDKAFAATMIPHHQAAIDMAKAELQYGADKNTKRLAEMIISDEQVEIEQMLATIGGENSLKVFDIYQGFKMIDSIATGSLPHGVWSSADGKFAYVGLENDDKVQAVDLGKMMIVKTIPIGQCPQALLYATNAGPDTPVTTHLSELNANNKSQVVKMKSISQMMATGMLNIRSVGLTDIVQQDFKNLEPNTAYTLALTNSEQQPYKANYIINSFKTDEKGTFSGQSTGIIKTVGGGAADYKLVILIAEVSKALMMTGK